MNKNNKVQIEVGATLDRSVGRTFDTTADKATRARKAVAGGLSKDINAVNQAKGAQKQFDRSVGNATQGVKKQGFSLSRTAQSVRSYTRDIGKAVKENRLFGRSAKAIGRGLDSIGNRWTAIGGGAVGVATGHMLVGLEERFERLGIQARKPASEMEKLKKQIYAVAEAPKIRIDPTHLIDAVDRIVEKTGNFDLAKNNLRNIGLAVSGAGASGNDIGSMVADFWQKFGIESEEEMFQQLDLMVKQGKEGAFTLQALATEAENVTAAYANTGRSGTEAIREMGALLQVAKQTKGTYSESVEAFQSSIEDMLNNVDKIEAIGVEIWDQEALDQGINKMRSVPTLIKEIITNTNGDPLQIQEIFGEVGILPVARLATEYQKSGNFDELDRYLKLQADGKELMSDSERASKTAASGINSLTTAWKKFADEELTGPIKSLTELVGGIESDTLNTGLKIGGGAALGLGALAVGKKAFDIGGGAMRLFGGRKKSKLSKGGGLGSALSNAGATPVFVTNMPGSIGGGIGSNTKGKTLGTGAKSTGLGAALGMQSKAQPKPAGFGRQILTRSKSLANMAGSKIMPIALTLGALDIGSTLMSDDLSADDKTKSVSRSVGGMGGTLAGAAAGATIGSVVPVVGTVIGGLIGSIIGGMGGSSLGGGIANYFINDADDTKTEFTRELVPQKDELQVQVNQAQQQNKTINNNNQPKVEVQMTNTFKGNRTGEEGKQTQETIGNIVNELESSGYNVSYEDG